MQFLNNNGFRTAVIVFIIFLAIPFLFTDKQPTALTPQQEASGGLPVGMTKNPLAKFFNRVASFYGLKKKAGQGLDALNSYADAGSAAQNLGSLGDDSPVTIEEAASGAPKGFVATEGASSGAAAGEAVQEYVRMDGKTFEVVKDPSGKKYVLTDKGPVSFDDLMSSTVSREEFEAAKKIAPTLSDDEIPYAIRSPYGVKGYLDRKTQGLLTYEDNPSLFGGPDGNLRGQRGSNLFGGPAGHSMFGGNEEAFDEAKSGLASKYAKARRDAATSSASSRIVGVNGKDGNGKNSSNGDDKISNLIARLPEPKLESFNNAKIELQAKESVKTYKGEITKSSEKKLENADIWLNKNPNALSVMERAWGKNNLKPFYGSEIGKDLVLSRDSCTVGAKCIKDLLKYPKGKIEAPCAQFADENEIKITDLDKLNKIQDSDNNFTTTQKFINNPELKLPKKQFLVLDGNKAQEENAPTYRIFKELVGPSWKDVALSGAGVDFAKLDRDTLIVVGDLESKNILNNSGFQNVVVHKDLAFTPDTLTPFYQDTGKVISRMANPVKEANKEIKEKFIASMTNNKPVKKQI